MQTEAASESQPEQPAQANHTNQPGTRAPDAQAKPRGLGSAVAFDWALTAQMLIMALFYLLGVGPGAQFGRSAIGLRLGAAFVLIIPAAITFALGEAVRRGWRPAWLFQIVLNAGLILLGLAGLPGVIGEIAHWQHGVLSDIVREIVLLIVNPIIVYLLTRPQTRAWIMQHTVAEAILRHSGWWLVQVGCVAILGGAAIAFNGYY